MALALAGCEPGVSGEIVLEPSPEAGTEATIEVRVFEVNPDSDAGPGKVIGTTTLRADVSQNVPFQVDVGDLDPDLEYYVTAVVDIEGNDFPDCGDYTAPDFQALELGEDVVIVVQPSFCND